VLPTVVTVICDSGESADAPVLRKMAATEEEHLARFDALVRARRVRPTALQPLWHAAGFALGYGTALLDEEFAFRRQRAVRRILRILELRTDPEPVRLVREHLADPARRANALELLDTVLDAPLRPLVMPFVDEVPEAERLRRAEAFAQGVPDPDAFLREHCRHANPYVVLLALDALTRHDPAAARTSAPIAYSISQPGCPSIP